jgi:hypothetical protein
LIRDGELRRPEQIEEELDPRQELRRPEQIEEESATGIVSRQEEVNGRHGPYQFFNIFSYGLLPRHL